MRTFIFPCFCANKPFVLMNLCCKRGDEVDDITDWRKYLFLRFAISQRYVFLSCWTVLRSPVGVKVAGWLNVSSKRSTGVCPRIQLSPLERIAGVWSPRKCPIFHQHPFKIHAENHRNQYRPKRWVRWMRCGGTAWKILRLDSGTARFISAWDLKKKFK